MEGITIKPKFICILGIDGSGKSTLAYKLIKRYDQVNENYAYIWGGCNHYFSYPLILLWKVFFLKKTNQFSNFSEYNYKIKKFAKSHLISNIYKYLIYIDYFIQVFFRISIPLKLKKKIIVDRYIFGTFIDLAINLGYNTDNLENLINNYLNYCPKPNVVIFIDIPESIAYERKKDIPSIEYLRLRREKYLELCEKFNFIKINGLLNTELLGDEAYKLIFEAKYDKNINSGN